MPAGGATPRTPRVARLGGGSGSLRRTLLVGGGLAFGSAAFAFAFGSARLRRFAFGPASQLARPGFAVAFGPAAFRFRLRLRLSSWPGSARFWLWSGTYNSSGRMGVAHMAGSDQSTPGTSMYNSISLPSGSAM